MVLSQNKKLIGSRAKNDFYHGLHCTAYHTGDLLVDFIQKVHMCAVLNLGFFFHLIFCWHRMALTHGKELVGFMCALYICVFWCLTKTHPLVYQGLKVQVEEGSYWNSRLLLDLNPS